MDRRALSPLISTLLLVAAAVIGGGVVYAIFAGQTGTITAHAGLEVQNLELRRTSTSTLLTASVKNTGSVGFDDVVIEMEDMTFSAATWLVSSHDEWSAGTHENTEAGSLRLMQPMWADPDYAKRRPITITTGENGMPADYQENILLPYDSDLAFDNFQDSRFYWENSSGEYLLPYWFENIIAGQSANVWVKLPVALGANQSSDNLRWYYGNSSATSMSNKSDTMSSGIFYATTVEGTYVKNYPGHPGQQWYNTTDIFGAEDANPAYFNIVDGYSDAGTITVSFGAKVFLSGDQIKIYELNGAGGNNPTAITSISMDISTWTDSIGWHPTAYAGASSSDYNTYKGTHTVTATQDFRFTKHYFSAGGYGSKPSPRNYYIGSVEITGYYRIYASPAPTASVGAEETTPPSGLYTSEWYDIAGKKPVSLRVEVGELGGGVSAMAEFSDDGVGVKENTAWLALVQGLNVVDLSGYGAGHMRVKLRLVRSSSPVVESFEVTLRSAGISLGGLAPGKTASTSAVAGGRLQVGGEYPVVIRAYSRGSVVAERVEKVVVSA